MFSEDRRASVVRGGGVAAGKESPGRRHRKVSSGTALARLSLCVCLDRQKRKDWKTVKLAVAGRALGLRPVPDETRAAPVTSHGR